jgi:hypothetical protein
MQQSRAIAPMAQFVMEETRYNKGVQAVKTGARMVRFSPLVSLVPMIVGLCIGGSLMRPRLGDYC